MSTQYVGRMKKSQKTFFEENGYAGPFFFEDSSPVKALRQAIENSGNISEITSTKRLRNGKAHVMSKLLFNIARDPSILDSVSTFLGPNLLLWIGHVICRSPSHPGQSWHIDQENKNVGGIHVSVAITSMNIDNGCMYVIPKTHLYEEISNAYLDEQEKSGRIERRDSESMIMLADRLHPENAPHQAFPIEMEPGQYYLTKGGLWHGVTPNCSDNNRMALIVRYMRPDIDYLDAQGNKLPCILVSGKDSSKFNTLFNPPYPWFQENLSLNYLINFWINYLPNKLRSVLLG